MTSEITILRDWLIDNVWAILFICGFAYVAFCLRVAYVGLLYITQMMELRPPKEMPIPPDFWIGYAITTFVACMTITLTIVLQYPTLNALIAALILDTIWIAMWYGAILIPKRTYKKYAQQTLQITSANKDQTKNKERN